MINAIIDPRGQISTQDVIVEKTGRREWEMEAKRIGALEELQTDVGGPTRLATN